LPVRAMLMTNPWLLSSSVYSSEAYCTPWSEW